MLNINFIYDILFWTYYYNWALADELKIINKLKSVIIPLKKEDIDRFKQLFPDKLSYEKDILDLDKYDAETFLAKYKYFNRLNKVNSQASLYVDTGKGFNESDKVAIDYSPLKKNNLEFSLENFGNISKLRFDPLEGSFIKCRITNNLPISDANCDNSVDDDYQIFTNLDPCYVLDADFSDISSIQINFEGCDYHLDLWVNGVYKGSHDGAYTRFAFELGKFAEGEEVLLSIRVEDPHSEEQVRGKQRWLSDNYGCWYVQTTGIWKDVWLEQVSDDYVEKIKITPDIYKKTVTIHTMCHSNKENLIMKSDVYFEGKFINSVSGKLEAGVCQMDIDVYNKYVGEWGIELWSPDAPNLYTLKISILDEDDNCKDEVESYFGMRDIRIRNGLVLLNGQPLYQRLVLDQGYWKDTGLTPENDDVLLKDIEYVKRMGFNGVRKHQKTESDRFLYWCDVHGLLVWGEGPSFYKYSDKAAKNFVREWTEIVEQNYNHPCIIIWTPLNESWGVPAIERDVCQQNYSQAVYHLTKSLDSTRPVISNDGWEHTTSDILTLHDYEEDGEIMRRKYLTKKEEVLSCEIYHNNFRAAYAQGFGYKGEPVLISEYGGIAFEDNDKESWGYGEKVKTEEDFLERYKALTVGIKSLPYVCGYCYTQLSDVQQEKNGFLTEERRFKVNPEKIRAINDLPEGVFWNKKGH